MSYFWRLLLFALSFVSLSYAECRFDNAIFEVPHGWRAEERPDALVLLAPERESLPTVLIRLTRSRGSQESLPVMFNKAIRDANPRSRIVAMGRTQRLQSPDGFEMRLVSARVVARDGAASHRVYIGANPYGRFEFIEYAAPNEELLKKYQGVLQNFLGALTFATAVE